MTWIVVGAGSAGCVVARRLLDAGEDVVVVESGPSFGPDDDRPEVSGPDSFAALVDERLEPGLVATRVAGARPTPYLRGRGVGGSSVVNGMIALDADPVLYADWGWHDAVAASARVLVPVEVPGPDEIGEVGAAVARAAPDARVPPLTRRAGRRVTSAEAYLWPVLDHERLRLVTDTVVDRIALDRTDSTTARAAGVVTAAGDRIAGDRVVVCAGAIHSPAILLRSHCAPEGTGAGLQDHPAAAVLLDLVPHARATEPLGLAATALIERDPIQILALDHLGRPDGPGMVMVADMRPTSSAGRVSLRSDDPADPPIVDFALFDDPGDLAVLRDGVRQVLHLLDHPDLSAIVRDAFVDDRGTTVDALRTDDDVDGWLLDRGADYVHAAGTCAMGRVVDGDGAVRGVDEVFVVDASVFPHVPDVNTHLPTTVLAERLVARWVRAGRAGQAGRRDRIPRTPEET